MHHHKITASWPHDLDRRGERGASLVEYALLLALIVFVCISVLTYFGHQGKNSVGHSKDCIVSAGTAAEATVCP